MNQEAQENRSHAIDSNVGFVGVGRMGYALALNALKAGFRVGVCDIDAAAVDRLALHGAKGMLSLHEMGRWADVLEIAVFNDAQLEEVLIGKGGILETARPGAVIAVHSTVEIETVIRLGSAAGAKQVGFLDVSMSGGMVGAEAARLCFMVGGEEFVPGV